MAAHLCSVEGGSGIGRRLPGGSITGIRAGSVHVKCIDISPSDDAMISRPITGEGEQRTTDIADIVWHGLFADIAMFKRA